jgi:hypothetical protein
LVPVSASNIAFVNFHLTHLNFSYQPVFEPIYDKEQYQDVFAIAQGGEVK